MGSYTIWFTASTVVYEYDFDNEPTTPPELVSIPAINWDPNIPESFAAAVTVTEGPTTSITDYVKDVSPLVKTLDEGDPADDAFDAVGLIPKTATELYTGSFNVLIDGEAVQIAPFAEWPAKPVTVIDADNSGILVATWNPETELYDIDPEYVGALGSTLTLTEMLNISGSPDATSGFIRQPGYVQGAIEDLANVNINTSIRVADASSWKTCTSDGTATNCTFTLRVTGLNSAVAEPTIPATPTEPEVPTEPTEPESRLIGNGSGCTVGAPGAPIDPVLPGMVLLALAGLWARKRRADA